MMGNNLVKNSYVFWTAQTCVHFMKDTDLTKRFSQKVVFFFCLLKHFEASLTSSVDPDQTAPLGAI